MGLYDADGKIRVTVGTVGASWRGLYNADGSWNVTVSPGSGFVGRYAPDGSLYVTDATGSTGIGAYASDGSLRVTSLSDNNGAIKVSGLVALGNFLLMETTGYILMEDGTSKILMEA